MTVPILTAILAVAGLLLGAIGVYVAPRLVAYRLEAPPPFPPATVLVPLVGVLLARWRVRSSLALQVSVAATLGALALHDGQSVRLLIGAGYCVLLLLIAYIDFDHRLVLNRLSYPGVVLALACSPFWPGLGIVDSLLGAATGLLLFGMLQVIGRGALGTGDTKLAVLIGAMRGFPTTLSALLLGILIGGLAALFFLVILRKGRKHYMAYAPYLSLGAVLSFVLLSP